MKKRVLVLLGILTLSLTGCGGSYSGSYMESNADSFAVNHSKSVMGIAPAATEAAYDGGYSNTSINSEDADYSYNFSAFGETDKSKDEMLADYEHIEKVVNDKGGFIEDVYNDYTYYDTDEERYRYDDDCIKYKAIGRLSFTVEIKNEEVEAVIQELDKICADNGLKISNYSQTIHNYENYQIVDNYEDDYYRYDEVITKDELDRRLAYADISVNLTYKNSRPGIVQFGYYLKRFGYEIGEAFGDFIKIVLTFTAILIIVFFETVIFYRMFRKSIYKHKKKHPELYQPKEMVIKDVHIETPIDIKGNL